MKDTIEDFVRRNRSAFDDREAPERVWKGIHQSLFANSPRWWDSLVLWRAAAVVFMVLCGYLLLPKDGHDRQALEEFHDVEAFYVQQISEKVKLLDELGGNDGLNGFTSDFHHLEAMYQVLKEEMKESPSQEVRDALVLNLLVQIDLLNKQLQKLEEAYKASTGKKNGETTKSI